MTSTDDGLKIIEIHIEVNQRTKKIVAGGEILLQIIEIDDDQFCVHMPKQSDHFWIFFTEMSNEQGQFVSIQFRMTSILFGVWTAINVYGKKAALVSGDVGETVIRIDKVTEITRENSINLYGEPSERVR